MAFSGLMVFCLRLKSVDKYGLVVSLPEEAFSSSGMLQMNGSFVRSTNARAEVSVRTGGLRGAKFEPLSCALVGALGVSLCTFSAAFGVLCAGAQGDFVEAAKALFVPSTASHVCLVAAALVLVTGGVGLIRYMLSSAGNGMLVLSDDRTHFSDADIDDIADRLNVSSANIANVRISKGVPPSYLSAYRPCCRKCGGYAAPSVCFCAPVALACGVFCGVAAAAGELSCSVGKKV